MSLLPPVVKAPTLAARRFQPFLCEEKENRSLSMDQFSREKLILALADWRGASGGWDWNAGLRRLVCSNADLAPSERR